MIKYPFDCISDFIFVDKHVEAADVILVPGSSKPQAIIKAAELYRKGFAPYILPSGGPNNKLEKYSSEWDFLNQEAIKYGVPEAAILREDMARNTFENARFSLQVLQDNGIPFNKVIMVCKGYHSRRALLTYQTIFPSNVDFFVYTVPDYRGIQKDNWHTNGEWIGIVMGEVVKIGRYFEKEIPKIEAKYKASGGELV